MASFSSTRGARPGSPAWEDHASSDGLGPEGRHRSPRGDFASNGDASPWDDPMPSSNGAPRADLAPQGDLTQDELGWRGDMPASNTRYDQPGPRGLAPYGEQGWDDHAPERYADDGQHPDHYSDHYDDEDSLSHGSGRVGDFGVRGIGTMAGDDSTELLSGVIPAEHGSEQTGYFDPSVDDDHDPDYADQDVDHEDDSDDDSDDGPRHSASDAGSQGRQVTIAGHAFSARSVIIAAAGGAVVLVAGAIFAFGGSGHKHDPISSQPVVDQTATPPGDPVVPGLPDTASQIPPLATDPSATDPALNAPPPANLPPPADYPAPGSPPLPDGPLPSNDLPGGPPMRYTPPPVDPGDNLPPNDPSLGGAGDPPPYGGDPSLGGPQQPGQYGQQLPRNDNNDVPNNQFQQQKRSNSLTHRLGLGDDQDRNNNAYPDDNNNNNNDGNDSGRRSGHKELGNVLGGL